MNIIKYFFVGGVAAVVDISLFGFFAKYIGFNYLIVGFFTFIIATGVNYFLSIRYVFASGSKHPKRREVSLVYLISAVGLGINLIALFICHEWLNIELMTSKVIATGFTFFWNYFLRKFVVFN